MSLSRLFAAAFFGTLAAAPMAAQSPPPSSTAEAAAAAPRDTIRTRSSASAVTAESWAAITPARTNASPSRLPVGRGSRGPATLRVQVLLSRALFSPGMIDGLWGRNTETAVHWLQSREGLPTTGVVDSATLARITHLAGAPAEVVRPHALTEDDVRGPFVEIPADIYEQAKLPCSCYASLPEKLSERFHATVPLLRRLNPHLVLDSLAAGDTLFVPHVRPHDARAAAAVAELVVSGSGGFLHAVDARGRILYHFPITLGSTFDPSPQGSFAVRAVAYDPWWHYQPRILAHVPDDEPDARIPPGPNSAVGGTWIALSIPRYGIHGTKAPETIGYATSAGCVRLTNWDVRFLSRRIAPGTPVRFHDTRPDVAPDTARRGAVPPAAVGPDTTRRSTPSTALPSARPKKSGAPPAQPQSDAPAAPRPR